MISRFVKRPLFTVAIFIIFLLLGLYGYTRLPLDFLPDIAIPSLTIITPYPGASAADIETSVSKIIEDAVSTVPNVDKITSNSSENISTVTISFKWGTDLGPASADVRDKMDLIRNSLPKDIQPPTIFKFDLSQIPILVIGLSADQSYRQLYELTDKQIINSLKRVQGVGTVSLSGGLKRQINIDINRSRLEGYRLSLNQIAAAIQANNLSLPTGSFQGQELEYAIRVPGEFATVADIGKVIIGSYQNRAITLSDLATISDAFEEQTNMTEINSRPGIMMTVQKQSGANTVTVAADVKKELAKIMGTLPEDIQLTYVQDTSESIVRTIKELTQTLYWAFFFVFLSVIFFLRNVRSSIIISLAMPVSLLAAFLYMFFAGISINIISLASLIISIGVVVDDAIVILENIYRHREKKHEPPQKAAIYGAEEVASAVLASTTTNLVIFFPLLLVSGFVGIFFKQLSVITIVVIAMSLVTAISLTPMLSSKLLVITKREHGSKNIWARFFDWSESLFERIENSYSLLLAWAIDHRRQVLITCGLFFFLSLPLFMFVGTEFFPDNDTGLFTATVELPAGSKWQETGRVMRELGKKVKEVVPELEYVSVSGGSSTNALSSFGGKVGPNYGRIYVKVVPLGKRKRSGKEIERAVSQAALTIPGLKSINFSQSGANSLSGAEKPVTIELYGTDFEQIDLVAQTLWEKIKAIPGVVNPGISREKTNPEYAINIDREKAAQLGLSITDIAVTARGYIYGNKVGKFREAGNEYDMFLRLRKEDRQDLADIQSAMIANRSGQYIALGNVAGLQLRTGPQTIQRKNQQRLVLVNSDYYGRPLGDVISDVKKLIADTPAPNGVSVKMAGSAEDMAESFKSLFFALLLGICLIYLVMVAQFESFLEPFIIMFAIPFGIVGVVWALFITGHPFGVMPFIGLILVTGVAVKTSIVFVDYANILRARGIALREAILQTGQTRLRPILMTTTTALLGLMPIVISSGEGGGFWKTMGIGVIGGLIVSAAITLIFVPTLYYLMEDRLGQKISREPAE